MGDSCGVNMDDQKSGVNKQGQQQQKTGKVEKETDVGQQQSGNV